uniref:LIM zinc-binding domain-containing protein n=1 Tax=Parascaris univalens TaxID=6257 RepID=A0A915CD47_PARUN
MEDLEALLSDLQHTTEVLKRANQSGRYSELRDIDPVYQEQTLRTSSQHGLDNLEQMLDDYSEKRRYSAAGARERPTVHSLFSELDHDGSRKNLPDRQYTNGSAHDLRKSPSRDPSQLDSMLGTLQNDMSKHGISTIPKGDCASCGKPIVGQVVIALGKMWHPEHYVCCQCGEELGHRNFFERGGKAYCENDYHDIFSPRCAYCNGPIKDRCVTALGKTFHAEHFVCAECGREFGDEGFHEKDGRAYCKSDFFRMFAPRCNGCKNPIKMNFITALGTHWHPECFVCQECHLPFESGSFYEHFGVPLCETHYHEKRGSLCASCNKPISGRCVSAMGHKFHPEHFCCSYCRKQLSKGTFKEVDRKPFCHKCYQTTHA